MPKIESPYFTGVEAAKLLGIPTNNLPLEDYFNKAGLSFMRVANVFMLLKSDVLKKMEEMQKKAEADKNTRQRQSEATRVIRQSELVPQKHMLDAMERLEKKMQLILEQLGVKEDTTNAR